MGLRSTLLAASALTLLAGAAHAGGPWYISDASDNAGAGWVTGVDTNNCLSRGAACSTLAHILTLSSAGDTLIFNPTTTPYSATINNFSGSASIGTLGTIEGDPTLFGETGTPDGSQLAPILQGSSASQIINIPTGSANRTIAMVTLDGQLSATQNGVQPNTLTGTLTLSQVDFKNFHHYLVLASGGTSSMVIDRPWDETTNTGSGGALFSWFADTHTSNFDYKGGNYVGGANPIYFHNATAVGNITLEADTNGALPLFSGTTTSPVLINGTTSAGNVSLSPNMTGTVGMVINNTGSFSSLFIGGTYTGQSQQSIIVTGVAVAGGNCTINASTWEGANDFLLLNDENIVGCVVENTVLTLDQDNLNNDALWVATQSTAAHPLIVRDITCNFTLISHANGPRKCLQGPGDGWSSDGAKNLLTTTTNQALGAASSNGVVDMAWTTQVTTSTSRAPTVAGADISLAKVGSPVGTLTVTFQSDSAGNPSGTVLCTPPTMAASALTTSQLFYHFMCATPFAAAASTKIHVVIANSTVDASNYVNIAESGLCGAGCPQMVAKTQTSTNPPVTWAADSSHNALWLPNLGWYANTGNVQFTRIHCNYSDAADTRERECTNSGPVNGVTMTGLICLNCGISLGFKTTLGTSYAYGNFWTSQTTQFGQAISKASTNVKFYGNTCILTGAATGECLQYTSEDDGVTYGNFVPTTGADAQNNIWRTPSGATPYRVEAGSSGTIDYNDVNAAGTIIDVTSGDNWATWQAAGFDAHSVQCDPNLPNETTPTVAADITPPAGNSCVLGRGSNQTANAPTDLTGASFSTTPALGAVMVSALCRARALLGVGC